MDDRDRAYFSRGGKEEDQIGFIDENTRAIFGRSYAAEPNALVEELKKHEAIAEAFQTIKDGKIAKTYHMENWLSALGQLRAK